jgi:hypothetical protein
VFGVGKFYTIKMYEDGEDGAVIVHYDECEVVEFSMPLLKIRQPSGEEVILNTASLAFIQDSIETDEEVDDAAESENAGS